jgi:tripartite-type tricarboxylate transporter receptor subunit TctC
LRCVFLIACLWLPLLAGAQHGYPSKPICLNVPYLPGGANDIFARPIAKNQRLVKEVGSTLE